MRASFYFVPGTGPAYSDRVFFPLRALRGLEGELAGRVAVVAIDPDGIMLQTDDELVEHMRALSDAVEASGLPRPRRIVGRSLGATVALRLVAADPASFDAVAIEAPFALDPGRWLLITDPCALRFPMRGWSRVASLARGGMVWSAMGVDLPLESDPDRCAAVTAAAARSPLEHARDALRSVREAGGRVLVRCGRGDEFGTFADCVKLVGTSDAAVSSSDFHDGAHGETLAGWESMLRWVLASADPRE